MSRSYRKQPCLKVQDNYMKHYANKVIRKKLKNINIEHPQYKNYKHYIKGWAILDQWYYCTFNDYINKDFLYTNYNYIDWYLTYKRK